MAEFPSVNEVAALLSERGAALSRILEGGVEWAQRYPLDTFVVGWFLVFLCMAVYIATTHKYMSPNGSAALWSFASLGALFSGCLMLFNVFGKSFVPVANPPLIAVCTFGLIAMSFVTHRYTR